MENETDLAAAARLPPFLSLNLGIPQSEALHITFAPATNNAMMADFFKDIEIKL